MRSRLLFLLSLAFLLSSRMSFATPKAWLLIAVPSFSAEELSARIPLHTSRDLQIEHQLISIFKSGLRHLGLDYVIRTRATESDLWEATHSTDTVALFWVGHSTGVYAPYSPLNNGMILDAEGTDVTILFKDLHPNMRWLSVVGCESASIFENYEAQGYFKNNPLLRINDYTWLTEPITGLGRSIAWARLHLPDSLREHPTPECLETPMLPIQIRRTVPQSLEGEALPVRILFGDHVIAVFPTGFAGQVATVKAFIPLQSTASYYFISVDAAPMRMMGTELGTFEFQIGNPEYKWHPLTFKSGKVQGNYRRVYKLDTKKLIPPQMAVVPPC